MCNSCSYTRLWPLRRLVIFLRNIIAVHTQSCGHWLGGWCYCVKAVHTQSYGHSGGWWFVLCNSCPYTKLWPFRKGLIFLHKNCSYTKLWPFRRLVIFAHNSCSYTKLWPFRRWMILMCNGSIWYADICLHVGVFAHLRTEQWCYAGEARVSENYREFAVLYSVHGQFWEFWGGITHLPPSL